MNEDIARAVREHRVIVFLYDGLLRTVEPHAYGLSSAGHELLSAFQTAGFSSSSEAPGWRLYRVDRMSAFAVTPYTFGPTREGFNPQHPLLALVFALAPPAPAALPAHP
ncbi:MAG: WYL domain-containing protein [Myxococcaceae bacterium]|nr:WYL domain-containing protein [Myxococcaceae bacterium]MCI0669211.1 WYL domain-containing protein [Myxococcaceae bacterium]